MIAARRIGLFKIVAATCLAVVSPAGPRAQSAVTESIERYEIRGSNASQLKRELSRLGPRSDSRSYGGLTRWEVTWSFAFEEAEGECKLASFDVRVESLSRLPLWLPGDDAPEKLVARWARYIEALETHEARHRGFGREAASAVERRMTDMTARSTCESIEGAIDDQARETVEHFRRIERRYDEETRHGRAEGVHL